MTDGLTLRAAVLELHACVGQHIEKVLMPEPDEIHLVLRDKSRVLISASPENGRLHLTSVRKENPLNPPMFCMLLRKWLTGGSILSITQINSDRIVEFNIERRNELFEKSTVTLVVEIMGRHSNIILLDPERNIIDSIKRVGINLSSARVIIPGQKYIYPPTTHKLDPSKASELDIKTVLSSPGSISKALSSNFYGLSPDMAAALIESLGIKDASRTEELTDTELSALSHELSRFFTEPHFSPYILLNEKNEPLKFFPFKPLVPDKFLLKVESTGAGLDRFYQERDRTERIRRLSNALSSALKAAISRHERKLAIYEEAITSESRFDEYRIEGEAIVANIYKIKRGQTELSATIYDENGQHERLISLDPSLSPSDNAQKRFKKYQKAKAARENALKLRGDTLSQLEFMRNAYNDVQRASTAADIAEIKSELIAMGCLKPEKEPKQGKGKSAKSSAKSVVSEPIRVTSPDGNTVMIGKNSRQNERVTFKLSSPDDIWLHVQGMPGSHVILKLRDGESEPSPQSLLYAAQSAAYYSSARAGEKAPVDYTRRKFVKKHPSGMTGMVTYTSQRTLIVMPKDPEGQA